MDTKTIGFAGLGLIGGSIAKTIRRVHPDYRLIAYNRTTDSLVAAMQDGVINRATDNIDMSFSECDYIFLCMPVSKNIEVLKTIKDIAKEDCIITDVGSVKTTIHEAAASLGLESRFIGGHPMAGSEKTGYESSTDRLLENAYYIITPTDKTERKKLDDYVKLVSDIGAIPLVTSYDKHDNATAAISHLPHIIAYTLVNFVKRSDGEDGLMRRIAAGGFRDITRIASSSPDMWESICLENKGMILKSIDSYRALLNTVEEALVAENGSYLHEYFEESKNYRDDMPTGSKGILEPAYELYVDIIDESGAIATLATILASNNISIKNIGIIHNREFQEGVLRVEFYQAEAAEKAYQILTRYAYTIHKR